MESEELSEESEEEEPELDENGDIIIFKQIS